MFMSLDVLVLCLSTCATQLQEAMIWCSGASKLNVSIHDVMMSRS